MNPDETRLTEDNPDLLQQNHPSHTLWRISSLTLFHLEYTADFLPV